MSDVEIGTLETVIEFAPETSTVAGGASMSLTGAGADTVRLRELLRPLLIELLEEELDRYARIRG